jgi:superfamily II DNA or RNA helicase
MDSSAPNIDEHETPDTASGFARPGGTLAALRIEFADAGGAAAYVHSLLSLVFGSAASVVAIAPDGRRRDDLDLDELYERLRRNLVGSLELDLPSAAGSRTLRLEIPLDPATEVGIHGHFVDVESYDLLWLQCTPVHPTDPPVLAVPVTRLGFPLATCHVLVGVARKGGGFLQAQLRSANGDSMCNWLHGPAQGGCVPLVSGLGDALWSLGNAEADQDAPVWFRQQGKAEAEPAPDEGWWSAFDEFLRAPRASLPELHQHLERLFRPKLAWTVCDLADAPAATDVVPPEAHVVGRLVPTAEHVVLAADLALPPDRLSGLLLHLAAHLALGHVHPGDPFGHWDTEQTATAEEPHRHWDRRARDYLAVRARRSPERQVRSLDDCTPKEKAQLGLWQMIGEMLGESRQLHPSAERYQQAAYQRQAAQRMVAMLEDYGGAMLCDGVGLGKTYVATTLIVHYANCWREQWAASPERLVEDPFRVTVLAPNSVVSTWQREALPALASFGVPLATVRVVSHTKLSRVTRTSELLEPLRDGPSDLEHLLLSDLVLVDEAHNFRSLAARRTKVLRDLLRLQPRREARRRVALLTATPVNNSLDDLRQEVSLLFSKPLLLSDAKTDDGYRRQAVKEIRDRCARARSGRSRGDVAPVVVHGDPEARFSDTIEFRDDLDFGPNVQRIGDYLKEQDKRLKELQDEIRSAAQSGVPPDPEAPKVRIAEELLDRIVVQRSRSLCKEIERQQASNVELLFRPDAGTPQKLCYSDEYDGIEDVLARFLPLFDGAGETGPGPSPLTLKIYMWYDVREGLKSADELSSVVGLQRVLALKRLESSPVSFLVTLLRLVVLHAHRLQQLGNLCIKAGENRRYRELHALVDGILGRQTKAALDRVRTLATGDAAADPRKNFLESLSAAYSADRPAADTDDPPPQFGLFEDDSAAGPEREQLDRLWSLLEALSTDFATLLAVTPELTEIVFGKFERKEWPRRFIAGGEAIDWPRSTGWGLRVVTDAKVRQLVCRLLVARRARQKVIVFSQFSDSIAYVRSVLNATRSFTRADWQMTLRGIGLADVTREEIVALREATAAITGETDDRDDVVNAFAPFYRIGPWRPATDGVSEAERTLLNDSWEAAWASALHRDIDVLLSSDVLAEGVNLQDAALLVNFDVHWNPVRMIQRSGRIDRRLNPRIEKPVTFPDLEALSSRLGKPVPRYYWHDHPEEPPATVNMILPDELESELLLRERIATKTMAIDVTLGLEQGTGAEADWMEGYAYRGIASLNSLQKDRAIEQIASRHERLARAFAGIGLQTQWLVSLNGWFRAADASEGSPLVARAWLGRPGGEPERFSRYLEPAVADGVPHWFWAEKRPGESMFDGWLVLDGKTWPPAPPRRDLPWSDSVAGPVKAAQLLGALEQLEGNEPVEEWSSSNKGVGRLLQQGISAVAAPKFGEDRHLVRIPGFFILQLGSFESGRREATNDGE